MWFKNLLVYRFTRPLDLSPETLEAGLARKMFHPCGSQERVSLGWTPPLGREHGALIHSANGYHMLCLQRQEKVLPPAVVNEVLEERLEELREREDRKPGRRERGEMREAIVFELLPRAFCRSSRLFAYVDPAGGRLVIDSASANRAEELLTLLRESLGSLPVIPLRPARPAPDCMTGWLQGGSPPTGFAFGGECELRDNADESAVIRCRNQDLGAEDIRNHLAAGMHARKLALSWNGGIDCVVDDKLAIRRLRFDDVIMDKLDDTRAETAAEQFDLDFTLMTGEFARFIPALVEVFGGEEEAPAEPAGVGAPAG